MMSVFRREWFAIAASLELDRVRRHSVCELCRMEEQSRRKTAADAVWNLFSAARAHRLLLRNIGVYLKETGPAGDFFPDSVYSRQFDEELRQPPETSTENPLKNIRESATYLISSPRIRKLQSHIIRTVWKDWFCLELSDNQSSVFGVWSNAAWLSRGLLKVSGVGMKGTLSGEDRRRLSVVVEPYARTMDLRRVHLEGLSSPGRALLSAWIQKKNIGKLRKSGFAPEDLEILYPEVIDRETLSYRRKKAAALKKKYIMKIQLRESRRRFENYMHLQTLILGAPSRGPVRLGRFMAAVERRQV